MTAVRHARLSPSMVRRVVGREWFVYRRTWKANAFSLFVQPALFLGAMGLGVGGLVDDGNPGALGGIDYVQFVVPGLLVATAMLTAAGDGLWGVMASTKWMGQYVGIVSTPMTPADVFGGTVAWFGLRSAMAAGPFLLVGAFAGGVPSWWGVLAVAPSVLVGGLTMAALASYSIRRDDDYTFSLIMRLGIFPLFLFSGTFFPVEQLPTVLRPVSWLSPLWHGVEAARACTTGSIGAATGLHLVVLLVLLAAVWPVGVSGFGRRLTP